MGERKVLNKYFPPDFDPSKLPKMKRVRSEEKQMKVRMMLPMTVRCNVCGTFMYKGTKFNTRMEDVRGETYLGIKIFRFYYRCTHCSAEFCMKTDPKNADYELEAGATRNYEPWRDREKAAVEAVVQREEEERGNAMKALENRTLDSRREMDILSALDEMKSLKARHEQVDTEAALAALKRSGAQQEIDLEAEDEAAVTQMLLQRAGFVRRLSDSDEDDGERKGKGARGAAADGGGGAQNAGAARAAAAAKPTRGAAVASVAASLWDEELSEASEDTGIDGDTFVQQQFAAAKAAAADAQHNGGADSHQQQEEERQQQQGGPQGVDDTPGQQQGATPAQPQQAQQQAKPKPAEKPPPALPKFAVRPVAVVVKRKADAEPAPSKPAKQAAVEGEGSDGGSGGGALLGLAGYGSSSGGESP